MWCLISLSLIIQCPSIDGSYCPLPGDASWQRQSNCSISLASCCWVRLGWVGAGWSTSEGHPDQPEDPPHWAMSTHSSLACQDIHTHTQTYKKWVLWTYYGIYMYQTILSEVSHITTACWCSNHMKNLLQLNLTVILPVLVLSQLQHRPHELLCLTGMEHKEGLTKQWMLLKHEEQISVEHREAHTDNKADSCIFPGFTCWVIVLRGLFWSRVLKFGWQELHTSSNERLLPSNRVTCQEEAET